MHIVFKHHRSLTKMDYVLGHKESLITLKKNRTNTYTSFSEHSVISLNINIKTKRKKMSLSPEYFFIVLF